MTTNLRFSVSAEPHALDSTKVLTATKFFIDDFGLTALAADGSPEATVAPSGSVAFGPQFHDLGNGDFEICGVPALINKRATIEIFKSEFASYLNKFAGNSYNLGAATDF
jgi:hypothetical protein